MKQLKTILVDQEKLSLHNNRKKELQDLLHELQCCGINVADIKGEFAPPQLRESLLIADCEETVRKGKEWNVAILGVEPAQEEKRIHSALPMLVEGFEEIDYTFLERIYQRFHQIPWTILHTNRCVLREMTTADIDVLYELYKPKEITRYMEGLKEEREQEEEYTRAYIENMYGFYGYGMWLVEEKATGKVIGRAGLSHLEVEEEVQLELGYLIAKEKQQQGFATEVCQGILEYAKEELQSEKMYCLIQKENQVSVHLAEKLGFCFDRSVICNGKEMQRYVKILQT